ncbi:putative vacuolar protein sorting-associated protein 16 [Fulvia fulva]|uniref:Probable vacuolar protein sorting-associated protein 16 homolog n=1 Tax=Passalora fulva TaxID=5499 RepID=A0A9Q8L9X4_PASFU|nr:putative vacuolar protein sorting-associated protein 16 [Fulvia fulva]KAK4633751.1 putative vacuolar protein sorting-associated protein 16 [Fulvia fulva]UJO13626.1 putative vacuolar protein sorting-associated protein 16 [Fulvia fulva]WPV11379.1 putative vacuolar protein sorting-associated protein 16 [Fulvia fulva]
MSKPLAPRANWERIGDRFYRKMQLYDDVFDPDLELEKYTVTGAPYSGAVALRRDQSNIYSLRGSQAFKSTIDIYSCAGKLIRQINWDKGNIKSVGWSEDERLLVVTDDGTVRVYADLQHDFTPFSLGHGAEEHGVQSCNFWSTGFVALLGNNSVVAVTRYDEPRPQLLASAPPGDVHSWTLIPPEYTSSRSVEVLLAIGKTVYVVDAVEAEDRGLEAGPFRHIRVSPNGKFIALYTDDGKVWVISADFQERFSEYDTKARTPPKDMEWCGDNAVAIAWEDEVHLIGPHGAAWKLQDYTAFVHLLPDVDGLRILTNDVCEFIQKVDPDTTEEVFKLGSDAPAAVLLDAIEQLENKSPKADDNIQLIRQNLDEAVDICVRAAGKEYSIHWQKQLLKAASFGKSVLELYNSDDFVDMTEALRVLNAIRFFEVGLPLSYEQYIRLTPEKLIQRLVNRQEYLLALKVSEYLHLPVDGIYVHWARQKVRSSSTDEESICAEIVRKLNGKRGISFEEVARAAYEDGRGELATELLEHEPRAGKQVPLLLNVGKESIALDKAIQSGDTDLVFYVLLNLKKKIPLSSFFRTINSRPMATAIVEASAIDQDQELLKDFYYQDDRRLDGANLLISEALAASDIGPANDKLKMAAKLLRDSKEFAPQVTAIEESQKLLRLQEHFEKELSDRYLGLSVNETLTKLIKTGNLKRSQKVQTEFKVSDKTYWWIRLRALVSRRDWRELEETSKNRKSPIGWEPFFNEILGAGNPKVASVFIPKCTSLTPAERIEMWVKCGLVTRAAEEALKAKDRATLEELRTKASGNGMLEIDRMIAQLSKGR